MTTVLQIARDTAIALRLPGGNVTTLTGRDKIGSLMLVLLNRGGQEMLSMRGPQGEGWPFANKIYEWATVADQAFYAMPSDFAGIVNDTTYDASTGYKSIGPLTPVEDNELRIYYGSAGGNIFSAYRQHVQNGRVGVSLYPTPSSSGIMFSLEYLSSNWVKDDDEAVADRGVIKNDSDVTIFKPHLLSLDLAWRTKQALSKNYDGEIREFEWERDRVFAQELPSRDYTRNYEFDDGLLGEIHTFRVTAT